MHPRAAPLIVLVNPWIQDFAAFDLWARPVGLLQIGAHLRRCGYRIRLIDCLDPRLRPSARNRFGTGKFPRQPIPKPAPLRHVPRTFSRYGVPPGHLEATLQGLDPPAVFLVTSLMTYWYPGVAETIAAIRKIHPLIPVILGGIYARLCPEHARSQSGADTVLTTASLPPLLQVLESLGLPPPRKAHTGGAAAPGLDLFPTPPYVCLLTSTGCPFRCSYCATPFLHPRLTQRDPLEVLEEISYWYHRHGVRDFAFYDDALLFQAEKHLVPLLEGVVRRSLKPRFHTPNALHIRFITLELARLMRRSGFETLRLGLESVDERIHARLDHKVSEGDFERAVRHLKKAGFSGRQIGAYILAGLPGQSVHSVRETVEQVGNAGINPYLSEYSPIPHTALWEEAIRASTYDLASEPLFHNNTLLPCWDEARRKAFPSLRRRVLEIRQGLR